MWGQNVGSWVEMLASNHFLSGAVNCAKSTMGRLAVTGKYVAQTAELKQMNCDLEECNIVAHSPITPDICHMVILNKCKLLLVIPAKPSSKMCLLHSCVALWVETAAIADACNKLHLNWHPNGSAHRWLAFPAGYAVLWLSTWTSCVKCLLNPFMCEVSLVHHSHCTHILPHRTQSIKSSGSQI